MHVLAFLGVSAVVIMTPGPDTALTVRNVLRGGRRAGVFTSLGVALGQAVWTIAAAAGAAALLRASEPAFVALRLLGAAYLVWLGVETLLGAFRRSTPAERPAVARGGRTSLRQGLISNLGNPKMAVFFTSLLPQFGDTFVELVALGIVFCSMTFLWLCGYSVAVAKAKGVLQRRAGRIFNAVTGAALVAFGARLASDVRA